MIKPKCLPHHLQCRCIISDKVQCVARVNDSYMRVSLGYQETPASRMKTNDSTRGTQASLAISARVSPCTDQLVTKTMHSGADQ